MRRLECSTWWRPQRGDSDQPCSRWQRRWTRESTQEEGIVCRSFSRPGYSTVHSLVQQNTYELCTVPERAHFKLLNVTFFLKVIVLTQSIDLRNMSDLGSIKVHQRRSDTRNHMHIAALRNCGSARFEKECADSACICHLIE